MTYALHLVRRWPDELVEDVMRDDARAGMTPHLVLLHDGVLQVHLVTLGPDHVVHAVADDFRRRGIPVPTEAVSYAELVELIAGAERVVSW
jgi:hypothetical protein